MMNPLPDGRARYFRRGRIFHQTVDGHAAIAGDPGFDVLHGDTDVGTHPLFRTLAVTRLQQLAGDDWRIIGAGNMQLVWVLSEDATEDLHRGVSQARVCHPGAIVAVTRFQLFICLHFGQHLVVTFGIFARNKGRHAAHGKRAASVTGFDQQA